MPPEEKPSLMDAVDSAIAEATPPPLEPPANNDPPAAGEGETTDGNEEDPPAAAGGEVDGEGATGGEGEPGAEGAGDPSGDGSGDPSDAQRGSEGAEGEADGKRKDGAHARAAKPNGQDEELDEHGKPKPPAPPDPKKPDHVNDPIPKELGERTRTRMTALVDTVKSVTKERDTVLEQNNTFLKAIAETGADPETFARHVEVLRLINSEKPEEQRQAAKMLRTVADRIAKDLGDVEPGKELEGHADLLEEIENGDLSRERATEIAIARNRDAADKTRRERTDAASKEQTEEKKAHDAGVAALNDLEQQLIAEAPSKDAYYAKRAMIERALNAVIPDIHPSRWAATYKRMYDKLDPASVKPTAPRVGDGGTRNRVPNGTGNAQPMRHKQGAGGGATPEPKSLAEAIDLGIRQAGAR